MPAALVALRAERRGVPLPVSAPPAMKEQALTLTRLRLRVTRVQVDVWALGVLSFEVLYGTVMFSGNSLTEIASKIRSGNPPQLQQDGCVSEAANQFIKVSLSAPSEAHACARAQVISCYALPAARTGALN